MLTHIGALVGCYCGNPRAAQIAAEGFFWWGACNKSPSVEDLRGRPQRQTHDLPDTKNDRLLR